MIPGVGAALVVADAGDDEYVFAQRGGMLKGPQLRYGCGPLPSTRTSPIPLV